MTRATRRTRARDHDDQQRLLQRLGRDDGPVFWVALGGGIDEGANLLEVAQRKDRAQAGERVPTRHERSLESVLGE